MVDRSLFTKSRIFTLILLTWLIILLFPFIPNLYLNHIKPKVTYGSTTKLTVLILEEPTKSDNRARYTAQTKEGWYIYSNLPRLKVVKPGTELTISGTILPVSEDEQFVMSAATRKVFGKIDYPEILEEREARLTSWQRLLVQSRQFFDQSTHAFLVDPQAALLAGIVAGFKTDLPQSILDNFKIAGLTHLIAVSGYNVTILVRILTYFTRRLGRGFDLTLNLILIFLFVIFTGASASVVRAALFASLFIVARFIGRKGSLMRLLLLVAVIMTIFNPLIITHDIGFQLSFAAMVGLVTLESKIEEYLVIRKIPKDLAVTLAATLAAQVTTTPLLVYYFHYYGLYSLVANLLAEPVIPAVMGFGLVLIPFGGLLPAIGTIIALPVDFLLRYLINLSSFIANLPLAKIELPKLSLAIYGSFYLIVAGLILLLKKDEKI